jgi:hypothetical protein
MEDMMQDTGAKMLSIWFFVGLVLLVYGLLISACGVYYLFQPDTSKTLWEINPSLWWGGVMTAAGAVFLVLRR